MWFTRIIESFRDAHGEPERGGETPRDPSKPLCFDEAGRPLYAPLGNTITFGARDR